MTRHPRLTGLATAFPPFVYSQAETLACVRGYVLGAGWATRRADAALADEIARLFAAAQVQQRHGVVDLVDFYARPRSTGERMRTYEATALGLASEAVARTLATPPAVPTDLFVASCTGYAAPGLDIQLARSFGLPGSVRRVTIGHMGCHGALVALRLALAALRADPGATALLASVELTTLHFMPTRDLEALTSFALFGDAAASALLTWDAAARGPEVLDAACLADFATAEQMAWKITDQGFVMGLSPRVPASLRRSVRGAVAALLAPHGLATGDIAHWMVHPGGPSILEAVQRRLELRDDQLAPAWNVLRARGNCSSATILAVLADALQTRRPAPGDLGVMLAFGPGLTIESALLRF